MTTPQTEDNLLHQPPNAVFALFQISNISLAISESESTAPLVKYISSKLVKFSRLIMNSATVRRKKRLLRHGNEIIALPLEKSRHGLAESGAVLVGYFLVGV